MGDSRTGADLFVDALESYGVEYVFGNPGTTELPVMRALADSDLEYVLGLHEDVAVGMAAGYAQTRRYHSHHAGDGQQANEDRDASEDGNTGDDGNTGEDRDADVLPVGVANLHTTPGVAHGTGNLLNAGFAGAPVVVTAGHHATDFRHEEPILSGDVVELTEQFCKWSAEVLDVDALPTMLRRAFRVALTPPTGPVFLGLPMDVTMAETDAEPERLGPIPNAGRGDPAQIDRAADLLVDAADAVLVVGDGVARSGVDAVEAAVALAEAGGLRVHGEILACEVNFPTDHDQWVSYIPPDEGLAATIMSTDVILFAGCSTNTTLWAHDRDLVSPDTTCVHVGDDAWQLGKNQPADAVVLGDPGLVLADLAERVGDRIDAETVDSRLATLAAFKEMAGRRVDEMGADGGGGEGDGDGKGDGGGKGDSAGDDPRASKAELVDALQSATPSDVYVVDEGVTSKYAMLTRWPFAPEQYVSNKGGGLGYGLPTAVGAAIAEDDREDREPRDVVGFVGDGSYLYYPHALYSAARYDVDLTVVIPDNRNYRILKDNTLEIFGGEESDHEFVGMDIDPPVDIPANAESHGATGRLVEEREGIEGAVTDAIETEGPVVLDVLVHD